MTGSIFLIYNLFKFLLNLCEILISLKKFGLDLIDKWAASLSCDFTNYTWEYYCINTSGGLHANLISMKFWAKIKRASLIFLIIKRVPHLEKNIKRASIVFFIPKISLLLHYCSSFGQSCYNIIGIIVFTDEK